MPAEKLLRLHACQCTIFVFLFIILCFKLTQSTNKSELILGVKDQKCWSLNTSLPKALYLIIVKAGRTTKSISSSHLLQSRKWRRGCHEHRSQSGTGASRSDQSAIPQVSWSPICLIKANTYLNKPSEIEGNMSLAQL